jgi:predicted SAM-dependent methyltransferase
MKYLNLGCGYRYHHDWTNINFVSTGEDVIAHNLNNGIPFPEQSFDAVYHSHVLKHFSKTEAEPFIEECYRVLGPQGTLRVVVPDLEEIARVYLKTLDKVSAGFEEEISNYEWILLEMYDQI